MLTYKVILTKLIILTKLNFFKYDFGIFVKFLTKHMAKSKTNK